MEWYKLGGLNNNGSIVLKKDSQITVLPDNTSSSVYGADGIGSTGSIDVDGGKINILSNTYGQESNIQLQTTGLITVHNNGEINILATNMGAQSATSGLIYNSGQLNVLNQGNIYVSADGTGVVYLSNAGNPINIVSPGSKGVVFDLTKNNNLNSRVSVNVVQASSVSLSTQPNSDPIDVAYQMTWNNNGVLSYVDGANNQKSIPNVRQYLKISGAPAAKFTSPISVTVDSQNKKHVTGYLQLKNISNSDQESQVYLQLATGSGNSFTALGNLVNGTLSSTNKYDANKYNQIITVPKGYSGQMLYYDMIIPNGVANDLLGVRAVYSVSSSNIVKTQSQNIETLNVQPIAATPGQNINLNSIQASQIDKLDDILIQKAISDAQKDCQSGSKTNFDVLLANSNNSYKNSYESYTDGFKNYRSNETSPMSDSYQIPISESNARSYVIGYQVGKNYIDAKKATASQDINKALSGAQTAIDQDSTLTGQQKATQKTNAQKAADAAKANIDQATDADGINTARDQGITAVEDSHVLGSNYIHKLDREEFLSTRVSRIYKKQDVSELPKTSLKNSNESIWNLLASVAVTISGLILTKKTKKDN
ncbi:DUF1542 domain-containing protein [Fructobacillus sp. M158]|uniref:DUF1542 domain-containing protein n=1 Tax=Fructobacillus parabroussonetiae TaxID=2713174 RepID=UPI00200B9069|nr:DUF1542 domain-containing protein [Fructobacillus parabroussonetiae]MCK8616941.1 DUF1542 domain-containing protein [Fructobacillus parabroussonetiae]